MDRCVSVKYKLIFAIMILSLTGCVTSSEQGNVGNMAKYALPTQEAEWIRNGEPIEYEGKLWYPQDMVDVLVDSEMTWLVEYRGVQVFSANIDVRPFDQLYTKFGRNKFRIYKRKSIDD